MILLNQGNVIEEGSIESGSVESRILLGGIVMKVFSEETDNTELKVRIMWSRKQNLERKHSFIWAESNSLIQEQLGKQVKKACVACNENKEKQWD